MLKHFVLASAAVMSAQAADAAVVVVNGSFTATDWLVYFGSPAAPIDPLTMSYTATFDTDLTYEADTNVLSDIVANFPYPVTFSWDPFGQTMVIATFGSSGGCSHPAESFCAFIDDLAFGVPFFVEQSPAGGGGWRAGTITGAIPEPATWAMLIAGFGLVGAAARRRAPAAA